MMRSLVGAVVGAAGFAAVIGLASCSLNSNLQGLVNALVEGGLGDVNVKVSFEMHLERFDTTTGQFETLVSPPSRRNLFAVVASKGKVVVVGGLDEKGNFTSAVEIYDPVGKSWKSGAPWTRQRHAQWIEHNGLVCAVGGYKTKIDESVPDVDCYDVDADAWSQRAPIPQRIDIIDPVVSGDKLYILGGMLNNAAEISTPQDATFAYDFSADTWTPKAKLPVPRGLMAVRAMGSKVYLVGGYTQPSKSTDPQDKGMLVYDPGADSWTTATQMPNDRQLFATDALGGTLVTYFGLSSGPLLDRYDTGTNTWKAGTDPAQKLDPGVYTRVVAGNNLYLLVLADKITGGGTQASGKVWKYDPAADAWSIAGQRNPDSRDALFLGAPIDTSIYFVGAFTQASVTGL